MNRSWVGPSNGTRLCAQRPCLFLCQQTFRNSSRKRTRFWLRCSPSICVSVCLCIYVSLCLCLQVLTEHARTRTCIPAACGPPPARPSGSPAHTCSHAGMHAHARARTCTLAAVAHCGATLCTDTETQRHRNTETERERERVSLVLPCCFCIDIMLTVNQKTHAQRGKLPHMITATKPNTRDTCVTSIFGNTVYSSC